MEVIIVGLGGFAASCDSPLARLVGLGGFAASCDSPLARLVGLGAFGASWGLGRSASLESSVEISVFQRGGEAAESPPRVTLPPWASSIGWLRKWIGHGMN